MANATMAEQAIMATMAEQASMETEKTAEVTTRATANAVQPFVDRLTELGRPELLMTNESLSTMQVNIGARCNLQCAHCHIQAGPGRSEEMSLEVMRTCLKVFADAGFTTLDITGGAPELHPHYRWFVAEGARLAGMAGDRAYGVAGGRAYDMAGGRADACLADGGIAGVAGGGVGGKVGSRTSGKVITRTNLAILTEPGYEDLPELWASLGVEIACSLPCYEENNTDKQRGEGVFRQAITGLRLLNATGYGQDKTNSSGRPLVVNLVMNPIGAYLPPPQSSLEKDFALHLKETYGVTFDRLLTMTNNPTGRFGDFLRDSGTWDSYMSELAGSFNLATVERLMCRSQVSVSWDGRLFDCDFNQALDWPIEEPDEGPVEGTPEGPTTIFTLAEQGVCMRKMRLGDHCYACTAGAGSSCCGSTT